MTENEPLRKMRDELERRKVLNEPTDFWFNGKLWSEMSDKEREVTAIEMGFEGSREAEGRSTNETKEGQGE